jgi:putative Ca2+/H+ antiporter (TMEM165/GDT1 family)
MLGLAIRLGSWRARPGRLGETYGSDAHHRSRGAQSGHGLFVRLLGWSPVQQLLPIFVTVFLAELGDKTQLATLLFAAERQQNPFWVFAAAATALVASSALAVALGSAAQQHLAALPLKLIAGIGFMLIGAWTILCHFR